MQCHSGSKPRTWQVHRCAQHEQHLTLSLCQAQRVELARSLGCHGWDLADVTLLSAKLEPPMILGKFPCRWDEHFKLLVVVTCHPPCTCKNIFFHPFFPKAWDELSQHHHQLVVDPNLPKGERAPTSKHCKVLRHEEKRDQFRHS